jgi:hypothetical protein
LSTHSALIVEISGATILGMPETEEKLSAQAQEMCQGCAYNSNVCMRGLTVSDRNQLAGEGICRLAGVGIEKKKDFQIVPVAFVKTGDSWLVIPTRD